VGASVSVESWAQRFGSVHIRVYFVVFVRISERVGASISKIGVRVFGAALSCGRIRFASWWRYLRLRSVVDAAESWAQHVSCKGCVNVMWGHRFPSSLRDCVLAAFIFTRVWTFRRVLEMFTWISNTFCGPF